MAYYFIKTKRVKQIASGGGTVEYRVFVNMFGHRELVITSENADETKGIVHNLVEGYRINPMSISVREYDQSGKFKSKKCGKEFLH